MRVLVIGGSGFIGSVLVPLLVAEGHDVVVAHRHAGTATTLSGARSVPVDRRALADSAGVLRALRPEVVVDVILGSGRQAREMMDVFRGTAGRIVALSSMDVYRAVGVLHGSEEGPLEPLPLHEDSPLRSKLQTYPPAQVRMLQQLFGWLDDEYDKIPVERAVLGDDELPATVLRLPMIYGPGDRLHRFFPLLKRMDDGRPVILFPETVARWRSPRGYVENVAAAIALAVRSHGAAGRIYNVAEEESFSELEWAGLIAAAAGWRNELRVLPDEHVPPHLLVPGDLRQHWVVDASRIRRELGYREPVPRDEAIRNTVEWERAHPPRIDPAMFDYAAEDAAMTASSP